MMPLPAALAAKLSKRGLISNSAKTTNKDSHSDYKGASGCPNKYNIYHECTNWCHIHWKGFVTPDPQYARNVKKLLEKYPLPNNWTEVFDKGIGRYYYWDMETDMVSWLPPNHPKGTPTECAAKLRMRLHLPPTQKKELPREKDYDKKQEHRDRHYQDRKERKSQDDDRRRRHDEKERNRKRSHTDVVDPMDPAAYSDVPRGTWSDGLDNNKSKADFSATGALFQQRPYPAPGDVLIANKQLKKK